MTILTCACLLLLTAGLRVNDMLSLRADQIDEDGRLEVTLHKTGVWHLCRLGAAALDAVRETFPPVREFLFPVGVSGLEY